MMIEIIKRKRWMIILIVAISLLAMITSQVTAAGDIATQKAKPTPSPTIDPILYQGSGTSITVAAALLVLIVIFGIVFTLARQKQD